MRMRWTRTAVIPLLLALAALVHSGCFPPKYAGVIVVKKDDCSAKVRTATVEVDMAQGQETAYWLIQNDCATQKSVGVGNFRSKADGNVYTVVNCGAEPVVGAKGGIGLLVCPVLAGCLGDFEYEVSVDRKAAADPELRVKGGRGLKDCERRMPKP